MDLTYDHIADLKTVLISCGHIN